MSNTYKTAKGNDVLLMTRENLDEAGQKLYDACRETYKANQAQIAKLSAHLAKASPVPAGKALNVKFTFGAKLAVSVITPKASKPQGADMTLAQYLAAQA